MHKWCIYFLKYMPVFGTISVLLHSILWMFGIDIVLGRMFFSLGIIPFIMLWLWSKTFGFCTLHRHMLGYICIASYLVNWLPITFSTYVIIRFGMIISGIILLIWIINTSPF